MAHRDGDEERVTVRGLGMGPQTAVAGSASKARCQHRGREAGGQSVGPRDFVVNRSQAGEYRPPLRSPPARLNLWRGRSCQTRLGAGREERAGH